MKYIQKEGLSEEAPSKKDVTLDPLLAEFIKAQGRVSCAKSEVFQE